MKTVSTQELQRAYDNWYNHISQIGDLPENFWDFLKLNREDGDVYQLNTDRWVITPEQESLIHMLNSPYRDILYKVYKLRHQEMPK